MTYYIIKSKQPNCKTCGRPLKEWNIFEEGPEHTECVSERIATSIVESIKLNLEGINYDIRERG